MNFRGGVGIFLSSYGLSLAEIIFSRKFITLPLKLGCEIPRFLLARPLTFSREIGACCRELTVLLQLTCGEFGSEANSSIAGHALLLDAIQRIRDAGRGAPTNTERIVV